jgi:hypothetical protein
VMLNRNHHNNDNADDRNTSKITIQIQLDCKNDTNANYKFRKSHASMPRTRCEVDITAKTHLGLSMLCKASEVKSFSLHFAPHNRRPP